jgi:hypothetical protein
MTAQETKLFNAFETTLTATAGASDLTFTVNSVTDSYGSTLAANVYLVLNPDSSTNREVIEVTSVNSGTKTLTCSAIGKRYLAGSAATSGLSHASGSVVRMSPLQQHIEDINDRVDTIMNSAGTAVNTSGLVKDEDDMSSDSATHLATQQSIKKYVDDNVTAQDLDTAGNSGTGAVDLDSQSLTVSGDGTILTSTASGQSITFAIADATTSAKGAASFSSDNFAVSSGAVTIKAGGVDLTAEVTGTLPVANGGTGATAFDDKAVIITQDTGTDTLAAAVMDANGELLIGGTSGPAVATLTAGSNITITNSDGGISIAATDTNTTYTAGDGLDLSGTEFSTDLKSNGGLVIESTELAVDLGASSITGTLDETDGGTGLTGYTAGDVIYASGTDTLAKLAKGSAGQVLKMNSGATAPEWGSDASQTYTAGDGLDLNTAEFSVDLKSNGGLVIESTEVAVDLGASSITGTLAVDDGGTGQTTYTNGQLLIGNTTGNTLAKATLTAGSNVSITNGTGSITIAATDTNTTYTAGDGLDLSSTEFSADLKADGGLVIESTEMAVDLGASSITGTLDETDGGTGLTSYAAGDILYASGSNTLAKLTKGSAGEALKMNSGGTAPEWGSVGSASALSDGDSDFTLSDGVNNGIHYELDNTDMADWNDAGIALTTAGGIFQHNQTQAATYTVAAGVGSVLAGPITITGTVTNNGTMVVV